MAPSARGEVLPPAGRAWAAGHNIGVYYLDDVCVNHDGFIFRRGRIYPESFMARMYEARYRSQSNRPWFLIKNYWLRRGAVDIPSGVWAIDNFSPDNYHHWMVDVLPRIILAEGLYPNEGVLLLPRVYQQRPYVPFTLRAFPRLEQVAWLGQRTKARVGRLAFVPRPAVYVRELIAEVARRVGGLVEASGRPRRIYFSRAHAARRQVLNEDDVVRVVRGFDFEVIAIDPAKPRAQIEASLTATTIVGLHGADLTNMIFMPPGGRLVELRHGHDEFFVRTYSALAEVMGIDYEAQLCETLDPLGGYAINDADVIVDLDILREKLSRLA